MIPWKKDIFFIFPFFQINGADMKTANHDFAVAQLTDQQRFVRLVVEREIKGPLEPPQSPRSPSLLKNLSPSGYLANRPSKSSAQFFLSLPRNPSFYLISAGYRRSIGDILDTSTPKTTTAQVTGEVPRTNGLVGQPPPQQQQQLPTSGSLPQPAPRTRLSSQNSVPLSNGTEPSVTTVGVPHNGTKSSSTKSDEEPQVSQ
jgi:hypothetical protein